MPRKREKSRIYWRGRRAYADFRDFANSGGGREALIPPGESRATTDPIIAEKLVGDRLRELQERKRNRVLLGVERDAGLQEFASHHLVEKVRSGKFTDRWLQVMEGHLQEAVEFFGGDR